MGEGVKLALLKGWESVEMESDATLVIDHIYGVQKSWRIETIIQNSLHMAYSIRNISWRIIQRTTNYSVDWAAKQALAGMSKTDWVLQPHPCF